MSESTNYPTLYELQNKFDSCLQVFLSLGETTLPLGVCQNIPDMQHLATIVIHSKEDNLYTQIFNFLYSFSATNIIVVMEIGKDASQEEYTKYINNNSLEYKNCLFWMPYGWVPMHESELGIRPNKG